MKKANLILNHLRKNPLYGKLQKAQSYEKLLLFLPNGLRRGVSFMYNKNDTLFFVFEHEAFLHEFKNLQRDRENKYKLSFIKRKLNELIALDESCRCIDANQIEAFVKRSPRVKKEDPKETKPYYKERSFGIFENRLSDKKIHKKLESIREIICSKTR